MKVGLLSDLHIGSPQSKWSDAATLINRIAPHLDVVIINGDITEELNPYPKTLNSPKENEDLPSRIEKRLNQFLDKVSEHKNRILFLRGNHDDQILNRCSLVERYAILRSNFGRIIVLHGHQTNLTKWGKKLGWGVQAGRALKYYLADEQYCGIELEATDYIIVGHCHVAYRDHYSKVYSPGCWVGDYSNRNTGWYIIINDEETDSPKSFIQMRRWDNISHKKKCKCGFNNLNNDDLYCPACKKDLLPRCKDPDCNRPLRGEENKICKIHTPDLRFYE